MQSISFNSGHSFIAWIGLGLMLLTSCGTTPEVEQSNVKVDRAQGIVDSAIISSGGARYSDLEVSFDFRAHHYEAHRSDGRFEYQRTFTDSLGRQVRDVLDNHGLQRYVDERLVTLTARDSIAYASSVNSTVYFVLQPYFLNDPAAIKEYLGLVWINDVPYHKIQVTFEKEGGGRDYEDEFVYWFRKDDLRLDYIAYNYLTDGGGARFREGFNHRTIQGIRFVDYLNYKPMTPSRAVAEFDRMYEEGGLAFVSEIKTENIVVRN